MVLALTHRRKLRRISSSNRTSLFRQKTRTSKKVYAAAGSIGFLACVAECEIIELTVLRAHAPTRAVVALGIILACCSTVFALNPSLNINQYAHTAWTVREGFFKGAVNAISQTPDGYLWLGTEFGLLRFDGARSVPWSAPAGEHLPSNNILSLLVTRDGRLWIGTAAGLASWKDGRLTHYPELAGQTVLALLVDRQGTSWAGSFGRPQEDSARSRVARSTAPEQTAV